MTGQWLWIAYPQPGNPFLPQPVCDAAECPAPATHEFVVGESPTAWAILRACQHHRNSSEDPLRNLT